MLEQFIGTIKNYFYTRFPVPVFDKELPENLIVPSLYFPQPEIMDGYYSKNKYQVNYTLDVQIFHKSTAEALQVAESITQEIRRNKSVMHLIHADGTVSDESIFFDTITSMEMGTEGIVQVRLMWSYEYDYI